MKKYFFVFLWLLLAIPLTADPSTGEKLNHETALLTAKLLLNQWQESFLTQMVDPETLSAPMRQEPGKYLSATTSFNTLLTTQRPIWQQTYTSRANAILQEVAAELNTTAEALFPEELRKSITVLPDSLQQTLTEKCFTPAFQQARKQVCEEQRNKLVSMVFPSEAEIDQMKTSELSLLMEERLLKAAGEAVFEENRPFVRDTMVTPVIEEAYAQKEWQKQLIAGAASSEPTSPGQFANFLRNTLSEAIAAKRAAEPNQKFYDPFPSLAPVIAERSQVLTLEKFVRKLPEYIPPYPAESIQNELQFAPDKFVSAESSNEWVYAQFSALTIVDAISRYASLVSGADHAELRNFLEGAAPYSPLVEAHLREYFQNNITPELTRLRQAMIEEQYQIAFQKLLTGQFLPSEEQLLYYRQEGADVAFYNLDNYDLGVSLRLLFDETIFRAKSELSRLFSTANTAFNSQMQLLEDIFLALNRQLMNPQLRQKPEALAAALQETLRIPASERTAGLSETTFFDAYVKAVETDWRAIRESLLWPDAATRPANYQAQYINLFQSVRQEILLRVRTLLKDWNSPMALSQAEDASLAKNFTLTLDVSGKDIVVAVASADSEERRFFRCSSGKDYAKRERECIRAVTAYIGNKLQQLQPDTKQLVQVNINVRNGRIYYQFVARLRERIATLPERLETPLLTIRFSDQLE